jgi:hypothetical protein
MGTITPEERQQIIAQSPVGAKYAEAVDRESAYEILQARATTVGEQAGPQNPWGVDATPSKAEVGNPWGMPPTPPAGNSRRIGGATTTTRRRPAAPQQASDDSGGITDMLGSILGGGGGRRQSAAEALVKSAMRSVGSNVGRQVSNAIVRGVLGSIMKR